MKNQRTHRRKLRFSSTTRADEVEIVTVHPPVKRRSRQSYKPRHIPKRASTPANILPEATWSMLEDMFTASKSLGEITGTVLRLLKEHENLHTAIDEPAFPIFIPASEIYKLKVPRKRRIYDVLHVLEGVGVIKRIRWKENRNSKGGSFLYYGTTAAVQRLARLKQGSNQVIANFRQACSSKPNGVEEDSALVKGVEDQATLERWPCLVTTTTCFLSLLFQQKYQVSVSLPEMSSRVANAKKFIGASISSGDWVETPFNDINRRIYDVVSVLENCSLIRTYPTPDIPVDTAFELVDRSQLRKFIRFNYGVFADPSSLFAAAASPANWNNDRKGRKDPALFCTAAATWASGDCHSSNSVWQRATNTFSASPVFVPTSSSVNAQERESKPSRMKAMAMSKTPSRSQPQAESAPSTQEFFSPLGKVAPMKTEWCDESFKELELYDVLPSEDKIDWEMNTQFKECYHNLWGIQYSPIAVVNDALDNSTPRVLVDHVEVAVVDLECHEVLVDDDKAAITASFLC